MTLLYNYFFKFLQTYYVHFKQVFAFFFIIFFTYFPRKIIVISKDRNAGKNMKWTMLREKNTSFEHTSR